MWQGSCVAEHPERAGMTIPLSLHGDGVPVAGVGKSWSKSATCYSWSSLLGRGKTVEFNFMVYFYFKGLMASSEGQDTTAAFWRILVWSFRALQEGAWPSHGPDMTPFAAHTEAGRRAGTPLADGFRACVYILKGDLEHFSSAYCLANPHSHNPCFLCRCNTSTRPWTDFRETSDAWRPTIHTAADWVAANADRHPIFTLAGVSITNCVPDLMHTRHSGVDAWFLGSVLEWLCYHIMPQAPEANLELLWRELEAAYQEPAIKTMDMHTARNGKCFDERHDLLTHAFSVFMKFPRTPCHVRHRVK